MTDVQKVLDDIKSQKNKTPSEFLLDRKNGSVGAMLIGGGIGLAIGYTRKYNLLFSFVCGSLIGSLTHQLFVPKKDEE